MTSRCGSRTTKRLTPACVQNIARDGSFEGIKPMGTNFSLTPRLSWRCRVLAFYSTAALLSVSAQAADRWTDISSSLLGRLTNNGAKQDWPGGCSGVVVNRTNGDVTIKVVGLGLWRSSAKARNWQRIDDNTISGRDETGWAT